MRIFPVEPIGTLSIAVFSTLGIMLIRLSSSWGVDLGHREIDHLLAPLLDGAATMALTLGWAVGAVPAMAVTGRLEPGRYLPAAAAAVLGGTALRCSLLMTGWSGWPELNTPWILLGLALVHGLFGAVAVLACRLDYSTPRAAGMLLLPGVLVFGTFLPWPFLLFAGQALGTMLLIWGAARPDRFIEALLAGLSLQGLVWMIVYWRGTF